MNTLRRVYLDANASSAVLPEAAEAAHSCLSLVGNPSSLHGEGQRARALIEDARDMVREAVGAAPADPVIFTSGATESNNLAVHAACSARPMGALVVNRTEHPSVLEVAEERRRRGGTVKYFVASPEVGLPPEALATASGAALLTLMLANNESGVVYPVRNACRRLRSVEGLVWVHSDAVQAVGRMPVNFAELGVDSLAVSGHKLGAPMGIGALVVKAGRVVEPLLRGGPQESGHRAGTENLAGILALAAALRVVRDTLDVRIDTMRRVRAEFISHVSQEIPELKENYAGIGERLPNTASVRVPGVRGDDLVVALDRLGVAVSSGAACAVGKPEPSHVLLADGYSYEEARETVRISFPGSLSDSHVRAAAVRFVSAVRGLQRAEFRWAKEGTEYAR